MFVCEYYECLDCYTTFENLYILVKLDVKIMFTNLYILIASIAMHFSIYVSMLLARDHGAAVTFLSKTTVKTVIFTVKWRPL